MTSVMPLQGCNPKKAHSSEDSKILTVQTNKLYISDCTMVETKFPCNRCQYPMKNALSSQCRACCSQWFVRCHCFHGKGLQRELFPNDGVPRVSNRVLCKVYWLHS